VYVRTLMSHIRLKPWVTIEIDRDDLPTHTDDEFEEWVRFCVGYQADIDSTNPLSDMDMTAQAVMVG